jgi:hypothetical protein
MRALPPAPSVVIDHNMEGALKVRRLNPREALDFAARELGWSSPGQKLEAMLRFVSTQTSLALDADRRDFREWLYAQLVRARKQRGEDGHGTGDLLVRSDKFSEYDTGTPYYWNELLGWTWKCDATLYTTADFKRLGLPTADLSVEDLRETQHNTDDTKTLVI